MSGSTTGTGQICGECGAFIEEWSYHICTPKPEPHTKHADNLTLERIAVALEKIVKLLAV